MMRRGGKSKKERRKRDEEGGNDNIECGNFPDTSNGESFYWGTELRVII